MCSVAHEKAATGMLPAAAGDGLTAVVGLDQPPDASSARPFSYAASRDTSSAFS